MTTKLRNEIQMFGQRVGETMWEAWERLSNIEQECPHHGLPSWLTSKTFIQNLLPQYKTLMITASKGRVDEMNEEEVVELITNLANMEERYGDEEASSEVSSEDEGSRPRVKVLGEEVEEVLERMENGRKKGVRVESDLDGIELHNDERWTREGLLVVANEGERESTNNNIQTTIALHELDNSPYYSQNIPPPPHMNNIQQPVLVVTFEEFGQFGEGGNEAIDRDFTVEGWNLPSPHSESDRQSDLFEYEDTRDPLRDLIANASNDPSYLNLIKDMESLRNDLSEVGRSCENIQTTMDANATTSKDLVAVALRSGSQLEDPYKHHPYYRGRREEQPFEEAISSPRINHEEENSLESQQEEEKARIRLDEEIQRLKKGKGKVVEASEGIADHDPTQ